jgi:hypothetical protein
MPTLSRIEVFPFLSFPGSAWERTALKLCFKRSEAGFTAARFAGQEAELPEGVFPGRAWEQGREACLF